ncbi:hypothetical protein PTNB85_05658 [Pyrenophora teres f. teres]|uniref:Uncharacterized protein n=1 Tax=Pyrenophora teres f. teres TaxID=97479 RepID=A0A6S6W9K0_9PLEO|nr:hypothetical protein HRS9139_08342 [Pyrenophora teres f. teres]KAE8834325.1 hypothetical protein PTNB85_05658 [Pyrenophora teres f. teres]KAE8860613.1 hypothetical protein PTNB29_05708 [Pyrenophora teres f. teres]CAE7196424.1 hypothetical protein PTTW11_08357 [Pyrenophora teres f. teres]
MVLQSVVQFKSFFLLVAVASLSLVAFASPVPDSDAVTFYDKLSGTFTWKSTPITPPKEHMSRADTIVYPRDNHHIEKRVFTSPNTKRAFKVVVKGIISAATWVVDFSLKEWRDSDFASELDYSLKSSPGLTDATVDIDTVTRLSQGKTFLQVNAHFVFEGNYAGKILRVVFNSDLYGSAEKMLHEWMINAPVATLDGVPTDILSWNFDEVVERNSPGL